jgi:hypothetical protein
MPSRRENLQKLLKDVDEDVEQLREAYNQSDSDGHVTITSSLAGHLSGTVRDVAGILNTNLDLIAPDDGS